MKNKFHFSLFLVLGISSFTYADSIVEQWKNELTGSRLTAYTGSASSSNNVLKVINFCSDGRYNDNKKGKWNSSSVAGAVSSAKIEGKWDVREMNTITFLTYESDDGQQGAFPIYLLPSGRVDIGGASYTVDKGKSGC